MKNRIHVSTVTIATLGLAALFFVLLELLGANALIVLLNGVLIGALASIGVAYHELILGAIIGDGKYNDVRQMTLGFFLAWVAIAIAVSTSLYLRMSDFPVNVVVTTAVTRYVAIIAALLQVTAPDFGLGLFHGRDRKVLLPAMATGAAVALFLIWGQTETILK